MHLGMLSLFWPFYISKVLYVDKSLHWELCCLSSPSESEITWTVMCVEYCYNQISSLSIFISFFMNVLFLKWKLFPHIISLLFLFLLVLMVNCASSQWCFVKWKMISKLKTSSCLSDGVKSLERLRINPQGKGQGVLHARDQWQSRSGLKKKQGERD